MHHLYCGTTTTRTLQQKYQIHVMYRFHVNLQKSPLTIRPYAYDVTEGRPHVLGVKRGTVACAIAKHAASGLRANPCMPYCRAGPGPRTD